MWKQYLCAVLVGVVFAIFELPFWMAVVLLLIITLWIIGEFLYLVYGTTNMKKVEKFIIAKQKEPIYRYVYSQGFGTLQDQLIAIDKILQKYKQPHIHQYYLAIQQLLSDNFDEALKVANQIGKEPFMSYTKALILVEMGNIEEAKSFKFEKLWMHEAIFAMIAAKKKDKVSFDLHSSKAIAASRGIQRLSLIYSFKALEI
ncbi:hypothetical protein [Lysinibacillus sp. SGAir0095]|uniref:hypothetical protein n=1 Tax=Lysinibacillus sp. SGAir0095 TaxID=2070463 RepID=UPI0010CD2B4C|nr:hypothetical protein [Lysinibacillus sp. SGAir0095]QCR32818.1 hypothetical protein C1N55_11825 [Lysinibacillus sp. SGAir0095]